MQKTYFPKPDEISREWVIIDADGQKLGRMATRIARLLIGKDKPTFTPGVDVGDFVVVVNADKVRISSTRLEQKVYYRHSGYPGGLKRVPMAEQMAKRPDRVIRSAVWGMLPHNRLGRRLLKKLKIYAGPDHPHEAQQPRKLDAAAEE
jgi:large subunit ribosomal protein L13